MLALRGILDASVALYYEMAPYLIFGFIFAGLLHRYISVETVANHLGSSSFGSVAKAVLFGIPLPLCSCSVIPAGVMLNQKGASKGSVISFFIATPITGIDSIFATYSLLGGFFAVARVVAATVTSLIAGLLANSLLPASTPKPKAQANTTATTKKKTWSQVIDFTVHKLLGEIWRPLLIGIIIGGLITYAAPKAWVVEYLGNGWIAMPLMLLLGIPMYVCSTGSIPIAWALMLKGMSPGAALVFLLAGPATNAVTVAVIHRELGKRATLLYLAVISILSVIFGFVVNLIWQRAEIAPIMGHDTDLLASWVYHVSAFTLLALIIYTLVRQHLRQTNKAKQPKPSANC